MNQLFFWQEWRKDFRFTYWLLLGLLLTSIVFAGVYYFLGIESTVQWQALGNLEKVRVNVSTFTQGMFDFTTEADTYLLLEQFNGSDITINYSAAGIFLSLFLISLLILITSASYLKSQWFYGITGLFLFIIACFHLDIFEVMPGNYFMITALLLYGGLAIYLNGWGQQFSFFKRLLAFALLTLAVILLIAKFGVLHHPVLALANYGIIAPFLIFCIFLLIIAFDVVYFFLYLTTFTKSADRSNTFNFAGISILYLGNVLLLYLKKNNSIDWDIVYLNDIILLLVSSILGFWGYKMRSVNSNSNLPFHPYGAFIYVAMAIISYAFVGYVHCTGNDPMMDAVQTIIITAHLCIGGVFFVYVVINFANYITTSRPVYEVVMQAGKSPVLTTRLAGLIAMATLLGLKDYRIKNQVFAGYYNSVGDVYRAENNEVLAKQFYMEGQFYDRVNFRSNYALGNMAQNLEKYEEAAEYYKLALGRVKTPAAYATYGNMLLQQKQILLAMPVFKEGLAKYPNSGELYNNLALAFSYTNVSDSTFYYIRLAEQHLKDPKIAHANLLGFIAKTGQFDRLDKALLNAPSDCLALENNRIAVLQMTNQKVNRGPFLTEATADSVFNNSRFAYYFNYHLSDFTQTDTSFNKIIDRYIKSNGNIMYSYDLRFLKAYKNYYAIDRQLGYETLAKLENEDNYGASFYNNTLGLWLMENKAWTLATDYLKKGRELHNSSAGVNLAIAYLKTPWQKEAISEWQFLLSDNGTKDLANSMLSLLHNSTKILEASDALKLEYIDLYGQQHSEAELGQIYNSFKNKEARIRGGLMIAEDFLAENDLAAAVQMFRTLDGLKPFGKTDYDNEYVRLEWELLDAQHNYTALEESLNDHHSNLKIKGAQQYYYAKYEISRNETSAALQHLLNAKKSAPFDAKISVLLTDIYYAINKPDKAYETILQAYWLNEYDTNVIKKYAVVCKRSGLDTYSQDALKALKDLVSPAEYQAFAASL